MSRTPDEEKRRRILHVAFEAFGDQGYKKTTIKEIADRANIAPGSIYTYFHDKDSLFLAAITEIWDRFNQAAQTAAENQQIPFVRRAQELFAVAENLVRSSRTLLSGIFAEPGRRELLRRNLDRVCRQLVPFFEEGVKQGLTLVGASPEFHFYQIRMILSGVLWTLALVDGAHFDAELTQIRAAWQRELDNVRS